MHIMFLVPQLKPCFKCETKGLEIYIWNDKLQKACCWLKAFKCFNPSAIELKQLTYTLLFTFFSEKDV